MATSGDWSRVGFPGNPVTGDPAFVEGVAKELGDLSDLAGRVGGGLDSLVATAENGGFQGRTADALRTYVKGELKTFMANIQRSFDMAAAAAARYARALGEAQDRAASTVGAAAALRGAEGEPLAANDPALTRARGDVDAEVDAVQAEAKILEDALREAARLVSKPVDKPNKHLETFFKVLEIVVLVVSLVAMVIGGPLGLLAFGLNLVLFAKAISDFATGKGNALSLGLAFLGILFPSTKGLTTVGKLGQLASSGAKAVGAAVSSGGRLLLQGGRLLLTSPGKLLSLVGQGLFKFGGAFGSRTLGGLRALPRVMSKTPAMLASALRYMGGFARSSWRQGRSALARDFYHSTAFVGGSMATRVGVYAVMSMGRLTVAALLPARYAEIARFGYRAAFRMGLQRGLHWTPRGVSPLGRAGSMAGNLTEPAGRNAGHGSLVRPGGGTLADRLAVPGTPEFNDTLDELADIAMTPVMAPRTPGWSSLPGTGRAGLAGRLDDMGVRPAGLNALETLDTVGLPVGTVPGRQPLGLMAPLNGRLGDDLLSPQLRTTLTAFDQFDEFGAPVTGSRSHLLMPPRDTLDQLRNLDALTGVERTGTGLLKPIDDMTDLARLSLDGRLGGLNEFQLRQVLDGEIDLVNVTPEGVVLRIGKADPVDVRVQLKDGVTVDVLGPADPRVPAWTSPTGLGRPDAPGIHLDDLARLIPDTTGGSRTARELLGLGTARTGLAGLATPPGTGAPSFTPLTLREIITGGATGKLGTSRFQAWIRTQTAQFDLDTAGRKLTEITGLTDAPPLGRAKAELDLSAAQVGFTKARMEFDRLGMNLDTVQRDITVMTIRADGPGAALPVGELRLLDDLGRPTGQWITMEPGQSVNWVLRTDSGVVPDVRVAMADGVFTLTRTDGLVTRIGPDGRTVLADIPVRLESPARPSAVLDLDGTRLSERLPLSGPLSGSLSGSLDGPLAGARLTTTFTHLPGGALAPSYRLTLPALGDGAFTVVRLDGDLAQRLPGAFALTDTATGARFALDRGGRLVDLPVDGAAPPRLDVSGSVLPETGVARPATLDGLGEFGELGALNRRTLMDVPHPSLMPEAVGLDARFGATAVDGFPTPVNPSRFDGIALSGADELTDLRLRVTEFPATDLAPSSFRIDVVDFGAPGGPVRLENVTVTPREGGGLSITGGQGGVRWQFDALGHLEHRALPLSGTDMTLRLTDDALNPVPQVVGPDGVPVAGATLTPVRDATGALSELTVRVPMPGADGLTATAVWRFEPHGLLRQQELPLTLPGLDGPAGLGVKVTTTPGAGGTTTRVLELTGPSHLTGSFRLDTVDGALAGRLPGGFTVTDTVTGSRFHFDADGSLVVRDLPGPDGSGFLRFTEGATPGTAPVRLDELGSVELGSGELGDVARIFDRTLDEAAGLRAVPDAADPSGLMGVRALDLPAADLPPSRMDALLPDAPHTERLSDLSDLSDLDLAAIRARLDEHWQVVDQLNRVPLAGVDELSGFDVRLTNLPASDTTPPGAFRLELVDRVPGEAGPVRASDFTVELLDDGGRFTVTDPTGTTRFAFAGDGTFLGRQTALVFDGLPEGLILNVTVNPGVHGTGRVMADMIGSSGATGSVRLTPMNSALAGRLPGGFTLTDTVTGSRFHFDHTGSLALRDLPAEDGSGFLRFTEGAAPDSAPVRLDELGELGELGDFRGDLGERFPLDTIPEHEALDGALDTADIADIARIFDRTLDEASGLRTAPTGPPVNLSGISGAMDFLQAAPDTHPFQALDLPGVQRLADEATASLERFGLRPELLGDQLRELTAQARQALRQQSVTTLGEYLGLPLATRLDDLGSTPPAGRVLGDFTVTPTPRGGPGGSRYLVHHTPSDVTLGFGPNRELVYQEVFLRGGPGDLDGLKVGITGRSVDGGPWTPGSIDFLGARPADDLFTAAPGTEPRGGLTITDAAGTTSRHYGPEGVHVLEDVTLPGDRGVLRFDADTPGGVPQLLDPAGSPLPGVRTELLGDGRIAVIPTGAATQPLERTVFGRGGQLLEETVAVRVKGGHANGQYWKIDHATQSAVRVDSSGNPLTGRYDIAKVEKSATGQFKLVGDGNTALFEREVLGNGNVVHLDLDRFGRARWTEFDEAGTKVRAGERIFDGDRRTFHDTLSYRWAPMDVLDVRTYTKSVDGGLIRAEKNAGGEWTWTRFDKSGTEVLSGTREWSWSRVGYRDTFFDPATGQRVVAQGRGDFWPLEGYHGSRQYLEHPVLPGQAPTGMRVDPVPHSGIGPNNKPIDVVEVLGDGGTLHVARISDQRLPAAAWYPRAGHGRADDFFGNLVTGDSMFQVSKWTETAADGGKLRGVRLVSHGGHSWQDIDEFGRLVRETRTLENGNIIEVGRSLTDTKQWAPAPKWDGSAASYELPWLDTKAGTSGTRHIAADGSFEDVFRGADGNELLARRSQSTGVREYLGENPARGIGADDVTGVWVDKNSQLQITGRRDHWGDLFVESHGDPRKEGWTWKATGPDGTVTEGVRVQNRGSLYSRTWDDSFIDFERLDNGRLGPAIRERNATGDGTVWIDATRQSDGHWTWQKTDATGTVHSEGVRTYQDLAKARWTDHIGDDAVRHRTGGRVREYAYTVNRPVVAPPLEPGQITLARILSESTSHFEPQVSATVNREVWQEFDMGKAIHRRDPVDGVEGRYRESESLWNQWREYQDGRLVAQRTITGRVWATDAFGRWANFDIAKLPELSSLPKVGGEVGLDGHRSWRLIGREVDFRGYTNELRGLNREFRDAFHEIWTGVQDGSSAAMPMWRHQLRKAVTDFTVGYLMEFGTSLAVSGITAELGNTRFDPMAAFQRAALNGAIGGALRVGVNVAYDTTRLGYLKYGLTNLDQGMDWNRHAQASKDDWAGEWTVFENPTRWRSGSYDFFNGLGVSVLTGFVNNAVNAAVFGVGGQKRSGLDALEAGAWGAAGSAFAGVTSGLLRYGWHATAGSRVFHRGGPGELIWQGTEAMGAGILNYWLNNRGAGIQPTRAFPPAIKPTAPIPAPPPPPAINDPAAPIEGLELP